MFTKCSSVAIFLFSVLVLLDSVDGHSWFQVPIRKRKPEIDLGEVAGAATTRKERRETNKLLKKVGKELNQYRSVSFCAVLSAVFALFLTQVLSDL